MKKIIVTILLGIKYCVPVSSDLQSQRKVPLSHYARTIILARLIFTSAPRYIDEQSSGDLLL